MENLLPALVVLFCVVCAARFVQIVARLIADLIWYVIMPVLGGLVGLGILARLLGAT